MKKSTEQCQAELAAHVQAVVNKAPPLTDEQRSRLTVLLLTPKIEQYTQRQAPAAPSRLDSGSALDEMLS